jgi:hypothetical protein
MAMLKRLDWRLCSVLVALTLSGGLVAIAAPGSSAAGSAAASGIATNKLNGVSAVSRSAAWAVGYSFNGSSNKALIERWNGRRWRVQRSPNPGSTGTTLYGVAAVSGSSAWAVGAAAEGFTSNTVIEHWNGRRWRVQPSPNAQPGPDELTAIAALSNSNAWAVGSSDLLGRTLIEHWNGRRWRLQASPSPASFSNVLTSVAAISARNVWAVGYTIEKGSSTTRTLTEHWNGRRWTVHTSPSPGNQSNLLGGVTASGPSDVWAVGSTTTDSVQSALIERWDGRRWSMQPSPTSAFGIALQSAARFSRDSVWVAGSTGSRTVAEYWNGRRWQIQHTPDPIYSADPSLTLAGVSALSRSNAWAVGYSADNSDSKTLIEHWNGRKWNVQRSPNVLAVPTPPGTHPATSSLIGAVGPRLWTARYNGPGNNLSNDDTACCVAVSPGRKLVFVTGNSNGRYSTDYATMAYNAATGRQVWLKRYNDPDNMGDAASSLAVSPSGGTVYVTGHSTGKISGTDYFTVAYNTANGAIRWKKRYNGPANGMDTANSVAVSPSGATVFVTGGSGGHGVDSDYATIAYSAATGRQLWVRRYKSPGNSGSAGTSVTVSPRGDKVFVTGSSFGRGGNADYATVGYNAATGAQLWVKRYNGAGNGPDQALSAGVSPGGDTVFVTGYTDGARNQLEFTTIAYNAATGARRWLRNYSNPNGPNIATSLAISPSGKTVFVTGSSYGKTSVNYATVAYDAATGSTLWLRHYIGPGVNSEARGVAVSPGGKRIYVTGVSYATGKGNDYATIAYNAATGAQLWVRRYNGTFNNNDGAASVAVDPATGAVYVTGQSMGRSGSADYLTIDYRG